MSNAGTESGWPTELLRELHCPYCASALQLEASDASGTPAVAYGVIRCACHRYPVVAGIPIIQHVDGLESVVDAVNGRDYASALLCALDLFRVKWARRSRWHHVLFRSAVRRLISNRNLSFQAAVNLVRKPRVFADYLFHRYANPSFLSAAGLMQLLGIVTHAAEGDTPRPAEAPAPSPAASGSAPARHRVLDLACGTGHSSYLIRHLWPTLSVFSVDHDFVSLYLAKRFLAPDSVFFCLDAEFPSPFADGSFDAVFCLDAFHYLRPKKAVVTELRRVATDRAVWLFPHLHNAHQHNFTPGTPLSPAAYLNCFEGIDARLFDETRLLRGLTAGHTLDLGSADSPSDLDKAPTLVLAAGPSYLWHAHRDFPSRLARDLTSLTVNPIYRQAVSGDDLNLRLSWPDPLMREECSGAEAILGTSHRLSREGLRRALQGKPGPGDPDLANLVGRFVVVPLPPNYAATG
jgi:SAM-dependent methyltransferase